MTSQGRVVRGKHVIRRGIVAGVACLAGSHLIGGFEYRGARLSYARGNHCPGLLGLLDLCTRGAAKLRETVSVTTTKSFYLNLPQLDSAVRDVESTIHGRMRFD